MAVRAIVLLLLFLRSSAWAEIEGLGDDVNPLNEPPAEVNDKERAERDIFGLFKKKSQAVEVPLGTFGFKTNGGGGYHSGGQGYGGHGGYDGHGGYGGGGSYGIKTNSYHPAGQGYGANINLHLPNMQGFKTGMAQMTSDFLTHAHKFLPAYGMCQPLELPSNVEFNCRGEQCVISCPGSYSFPNGKEDLKLNCIGGSWIIRDSEYTGVPPCQASCKPPCQNNGICLEAGICRCSENFSGPLCQYKKSICAVKPPIPKNSKVSCTNNVCNAECMRGFQFPDGSSITNIECQNGQWIHTKSGFNKPPDCKPICEPPCGNGGRCISFNRCECPKMYRGDSCQFSISSCNVTKTNFNGNFKCTYDNEEAKCKFMCPQVPGLKVEGSLDIEYKCKYSDGEYYPRPLPKCIYPPGYSISGTSKTAHFSKQEGYVMGGGGGTFGIQYATQRERTTAIIAKFTDYIQHSEWWSSEENFVSPSSYSLYTTGDVNVEIDLTPRPAMCVTWGGINMKTFDGLIFKAPLSCSHTLLLDKVDATFDITLKACPYGSGYGCAHTLNIYWQSVHYTFENLNGTVRLSTPTKRLPIPVQVMGMKVIPVAQHLQIELGSVGLQLDWDRHQYVAVHAGPMLWNKVGGLCGCLDGDYENDLMSKTGAVLQTVKSFTDAWRVPDDSDLCVMENSAELEFGSESCDLNKRKKALEVCGRLLANEKLETCVRPLNFEALLRTCVDDYCNCPNREHPESCNCDAIAMLAKECIFKDIKLPHGWRDLEICPVSCSNGRFYLPCGPDIEPTCDMSVTPNKGKCNEGCFCPEGTVQYKEACITPELCPCTMRGKEFKPESTIKKQCNTCTCKEGQWKCTDEQCGARCGAIGDPHYQTFDGKRYDFMGKCSYYLLKTPKLSIEGENVACSGAISANLNLVSTAENPSCTKSVTIHYTLKNGVPTTLKLGQGLSTLVNEKEITKFPKILGAGEVLIRQASSTFMTVEFPEGIRIWWDGVSRVYIDVPPSYRDKTAGLCGTFNSNTQDDFFTPEGDIETAVEPFADKWRTKDTCDFLTDTVPAPHPCSVNPEKREIGEKHCAWITDDIFQDCHWTVEPEQYYEDCLYDVCACKDEPDKCFCPILSAYGTECMRQGIKTGWRMAVKECAVKCPMGQIYDECGDSCTRTCADLVAKNTCKKECVEGCRCPHGEYLNDQNECVPEKKCPCLFDGMSFKPGYKEVRPGAKFMDLCTCDNGVWECEEAAPGDKERYPPSSELRAECANRPFAEFSKCAPKEPKTCKNMHDYVEHLEDCTPGCVCMAGYVYDTSRKACVLPENCSCHHAGKSYNDGEQMKEACNVCICQSGNWKCSANDCESTCSVWGDSHFTSFDNNQFDFQGACDYILSKGTADNGDGYRITIQNILCGTMGVTCSKSVEIALSGSVQDTLTLNADSTYLQDPDKSNIKRLRDAIHAKGHDAFHIYKSGVFIVVEVLPLKLQLKWDEGTRVYVKLGKEWKNKVSGLCGNYNDNAMDDMQSPTGGLETSPLIFGHAWKVQKFCAQPTLPIDACKEHPERETWAQLKCGVLKSDTFKDCHAEVPVEKYLKRCIFDTCACDQGGDCECLCTAIAAYAHSCSQKGINIRWRTPHFCPMQCDPHCAEYKSCTPACAVETCDNFLDQGITESMCNNENCVEGCHIKACDEGMIYLNDTYKECVPKATCKPVCMIKDGKTFYEGDVTYQDACATCRCSKKKEVCSGVKCADEFTTPKFGKLTETTTMNPMGMQEQPKCVRGWTRWFDEDHDASGKVLRLNDEEKLPRYDRMESIYGTCQKKYMKKIECRVVESHESSDFMDENVFCNLQDGLACVGQCHDYEIRVFCECEEIEASTVLPLEEPQIAKPCDNLIAEYKEYPGDCHKFLQCQPKDVTGEWLYVEKTCGDFMMFNPTINVCDHIATVQEIKPVCGKRPPTLEIEDRKECSEGMVMSECANQCEHACHFYGEILRRRGLCLKGEHCKPGCVEKGRPECHTLGKYWRDENTCVEADECPCMDKQERYVKPHMPVIGKLEICQCIDNVFTCVPNQVVETNTKPPDFLATTPDESAENEILVFPHTFTPPIECPPENLAPVIQADSPLPEKVFAASSELSPAHAAPKARLTKDKTGSWSPSINDQSQYLQISFSHAEPLFGVVVAGSPEFDNYVTLFKILYSHDGEAFHYLADETEEPQMFNGPLDSRKPVKSLFKIPIEAKAVRIYPLKWHNSIAMRVELLGCAHHVNTTTIAPMRTTTPFDEWQDELPCNDKMGVDNGKMSAKQVQASSIYQLPKPAKKPRLIDLLKLSSPVGWRPIVNGANTYVEFDFLEPRNISGFITKGGPAGWVTGYKVKFSKNRGIWNNMLSFEGQPQVMPGNVDADTEKVNRFRTPILTQYIKLVPAKWEKNINMRIEPVGCFEEYLEVKEKIVEVEKPKSKCAVCDGVIDPTPNAEECKCKEGLYWDGKTCLQSNLCPCVENYITYPIGSTFENKNCEECVCLVGGHPKCSPKKCPPCEQNMRPIVSSGCYCKCEPCPKYQKLCPSSGDCIPAVLWCNGVQDCADDEDATCVDKFDVSPGKIKQKNETVVITCPTPVCPPQTKMKINEKKARKMSQMFASSFSKRVTMTNDGNKVTRTKVITATEEFEKMPEQEVDIVEEDMCSEFTCMPIITKEVAKNQTMVCVEPKCPPNYNVEVDMSNAKPGDCQKYACVLRPNKDNVCDISGKSFTTFDGTEFKYETCSHILARDLANSNWVISVHLQCEDEARKICRKMITIKDLASDIVLTILPSLKVNFNGHEYSVQQLANSATCKAAFVLSQPGNTVLVVSLKHGFWVQYERIGHIKIGMCSKFVRTVDGLCGYYNGMASDDKRAPDGTLMPSTAKFGDSWFDKKIPKEECYPQTCPIALKTKALNLCNTIKHHIFAKCGKAVNYKEFCSKWIETTCECLKANNGDVNTCKCNMLQDFVKQCLAVRPDVQLDTWRAVHQCEIACPAPLVHSDCFKRRCEPSCDTINSDDCPVIADACFTGCYCPEGMVRKGETCVPIAECKDCVCNSFGTSKYFTYDRKSFTFNGNCTYLLSRDIVLPGVHTFQVYVTMDDCKKLGIPMAAAHTSCAKSLHVLNGDHVIHIQRLPNNTHTLQTFVDGFEVKRMPYKDVWINMREAYGKELVLTLPGSHVELTAAFEDLVFSLGVPSIKYGSKMEGLCGDCNGNPSNDLLENPAKKKGRKPSSELNDVIKSWQADEPKLGLDANECLSEEVLKDECLPLPPEKDPCLLLFNDDLFGKCNQIVDPFPYVSVCQQDMCKPGNNQQGACDSLSAYAKECSVQGICLNWRRPDICPFECPDDKIYHPCSCAKTCDTIKAMNEFDAVNVNTNAVVKTVDMDDMCPKEDRYEGCFCPVGKVMDQGKCISEEKCNKCDDSVHMPGEKWKKDKCTDCACDMSGKTECREKNCAIEENICAEGYRSQKIVSDDECCPRYACVPELKQPKGKLCAEPVMPVCGPSQVKKEKIDQNECPRIVCECIPKEECPELPKATDLKPGEKVVLQEAGCCPTQKIVCDESKCPPALEACPQKYYKVEVIQETTDCCPSYVCAPPKDGCIIPYGLMGEPEFKRLGEKWVHPKDPCKHELCAYGPNDTTQITGEVTICSTQCKPGFVYMKDDPTKCCGTCVQNECIFEMKYYKPDEVWKSADNCTTYSCEREEGGLIVSSAKETCADVSKCPAHLLVEDGCCKYCKMEPYVENQSNCLPVSLAEKETIKLIEVKNKKAKCFNLEPVQGFTQCEGTCNSGSKYNALTHAHDKICNCCNIKGFKKITVRLVCGDGSTINKELDIPDKCGCQPCTDSATYHNAAENHFDIRLLPIPSLLETMRH